MAIDANKKALEAYPIHPSPVDIQITLKKGEDTHIDLRKGYTQAVIEYESLPKISGWVARDKDGALILYSARPKRERTGFWRGNKIKRLDDNAYKITWESEPRRVELLINIV